MTGQGVIECQGVLALNVHHASQPMETLAPFLSVRWSKLFTHLLWASPGYSLKKSFFRAFLTEEKTPTTFQVRTLASKGRNNSSSWVRAQLLSCFLSLKWVVSTALPTVRLCGD